MLEKLPITHVDSFELRRDAYDDFIKVVLPTGSYDVEFDELRDWLSKMIHPSMVNKVADCIYNFRVVKYNLKDERMIIPF